MKNFTLYLIIILTGLLTTSCQKEDLYNDEAEARNASVFIYDSFLVGSWKINSMIVNKDVDLNGDEDHNKDLLQETSCFGTMGFEFKANKTFTMVNGALDLKARDQKDVYSCGTDKVFAGSWSLKNDVLYLYTKINYQIVEHKIHLILTEDTFAFEVNDFESNEFLNDQGGTTASGLKVVSLEYARKAK